MFTGDGYRRITKTNYMEILLKRTIFSDKVTVGDLSIDGVPECHILEDTDRGLTQEMPLSEIVKKKIHSVTCIPYGRYEITITKSERFSKLRGKDVFLPLLNDVPGFSGIRIHTGNKPEDTEGCLLTGTTVAPNNTITAGTSTIAFNNLFNKIQKALSLGQKVFITITK